MYPKLVSIGDFFLPTYGVLVALGFLAGLWTTIRWAKRANLNPEVIGNLAVYCALAGLAGAKLLMFVFNWGEYAADPGRIFSLTTLLSAGVYYGGFLAAAAFGLYYMRRMRLPAWKTLDVFSPGVALGHAIGRLGCFAAGCCWGTQCDRPWAVTFRNPDAHALVGVPLNVALHPSQIYEAFLTLVVFVLVSRLALRQLGTGRVFAWYLVLYSTARFGVEYFRAHEQAPPFGGSLSMTQWIALGLLITGWVILFLPRAEKGLQPADI